MPVTSVRLYVNIQGTKEKPGIQRLALSSTTMIMNCQLKQWYAKQIKIHFRIKTLG